jgi:23S rRNA (uracil1939-C5)-methyltransferase
MSAIVDLTIERPVAGGRMLARHEGRVALVAGAIPGERVRARIERSSKQTLFASVTEVLEASPFRRETSGDSRCGGLLYAHILPAHQCALKAAIVTDAFRRIGGLTVVDPVVAASPEDGYRLRARLHVQRGRAGFFLEGTHVLCDAAATRQLHVEAMPVIEALLAQLGGEVALCEAVSVAENVQADQRVVHIEPREGARIGMLEGRITLREGLTGVTVQAGRHVAVLAGVPWVSDRADTLFVGHSPVPTDTTWVRSAASFFQGNRFLVGDLVAAVLSAARGSRVLDLYAGVGLFAVALAASGTHVTAVEADPASANDLEANASHWPDHLRVVRTLVETEVPRMAPGDFDTIVLDPPRTGASPEALSEIVRLSAARIVYVSCDPATLARDAKVVVAAGYGLTSIAGFDLFPNTPHVETLAIFDRR